MRIWTHDPTARRRAGVVPSPRRLAAAMGAGALFAAATLPAQALTVTTANGNGADAYVLITDPDANFGTETRILVKNGPETLHRKAYMRFDLGGIGPGAITAATFSWTLVSGSGADTTAPASVTFSVFGLNDGEPGETWDEEGITWNNAPANDTGNGSGVIGAQATFLGSFVIDAPDDAAGDVFNFTSADLVNFLSGDTDGLATLIVTRQTPHETAQAFASRENPDFAAPTLALVLTAPVTAVPAPPAIALFGVGLAGALLLRGRRPG